VREAYLTGSLEPGRSRALDETEQFLLQQTDRESYDFYDCMTHGIFAVANSAGLSSATCPHGRQKCKHVYEVPDPLGYSERHHASQYPVHAPVASRPAPAPLRVHQPEETPPWDDEPDEKPEPEEPAGPVLTEIEHYAGLMLSPQEVCIVLGLDYRAEQFNHSFLEQYQRGHLLQVAQLRATIFDHAKGGSAPAQMEALKLIRYQAIAAAAND
jgi:hypothetical protein